MTANVKCLGFIMDDLYIPPFDVSVGQCVCLKWPMYYSEALNKRLCERFLLEAANGSIIVQGRMDYGESLHFEQRLLGFRFLTSAFSPLLWLAAPQLRAKGLLWSYTIKDGQLQRMTAAQKEHFEKILKRKDRDMDASQNKEPLERRATRENMNLANLEGTERLFLSFTLAAEKAEVVLFNAEGSGMDFYNMIAPYAAGKTLIEFAYPILNNKRRSHPESKVIEIR